MPGPQTSEVPYGSHQFADRPYLTGWFGKLVDLIGRDNLKSLHEKYGPLPDFERPKLGYRHRIISLIRDNIKAGLTVSLVSIPLALSLAVSAGATPNMGLASAVWGGLFAASLGGSQYNIAGPTASGAGILAVYSLRYGYQILPFISILSGIFMLIALFLRLDKYVLLLPGAVMHGWTIGVAFTIAGNQLSAAFGLNGLKRHEQFYLNIYEVLSHLGNTQVGPFFVFLIAVVFIVTMGFLRPKIPWTIIVALSGIFIGILAEYNVWFFHMDTLNGKYQGLRFSLFQTPTFKSTFFTGEILTASFEIAFISILESLLSAKVADRITNTRFAQPLEVFGIAWANIIAGTFNGIPVTAALARTALNINSGATNRMAAILNAVSCGVISVLLIRVLGYLPLAIIGALLVNVAIRMVNLRNLTHLWLYDATMFRIAVFTALVTIFMDPAQGIIYGAVVSIFLYGLKNSEAWAEITAGNDTVEVVTHSSIELDRQALVDTFERQFPPTKRDEDENSIELEERGASARGAVNQNGRPASSSMDAAVRPRAGEAQVPLDQALLDENYDSDEEYGQMEEANRVFITAPKYRADHLVVRFPGELSYLNSDHHADRLLPLLNTGRFLILHMKQTYYVDMDGLDFLTDAVHKVEKVGNRVIVSGVTSQILPKLETMDWFVRAREEDRIVPDYKNAIFKIRQLDREDQRRYEEANYHDITSYEMEETRRHEQYLANVERARVEREQRTAKVEEEERLKREKSAEEEAAREEAHQLEVAKRQAALEAKRKRDAEEFEKRLAEFETKKRERDAQKQAYMQAAAESSFMGAPSITVPHHHDHHAFPKRTASSLGLRLAETPVHEDHSASSSDEHAHTSAAPSSNDDHSHVQGTHETPAVHVKDAAPHTEHTPTVTDASTAPTDAAVETPVSPSDITEPATEDEPKTSVVIHSPEVEEETPKTETPETIEEPVQSPSEVTEPASVEPAESHEQSESPSVEETVTEAPPDEVTVLESEPAATEVMPEPVEMSEPAPSHEVEQSPREVVQIPDEPIQNVPVPEPAQEAEPEPVHIESPVEESAGTHADTIPHDEDEDAHDHEDGHNQPTTPPPDSEVSSVASDGPSGVQLSPRYEAVEPRAPLDEDDPLEAIPTETLPSGDSAPHLTIPGFHDAQVQAEHEAAAEEPSQTTESEPSSSQPSTEPTEAHAAPETHTPADTIEYVDPFAEFASETSSVPTTPAKPTSTHETPASPIPMSSDYIDPFADFGADLSTTSAPAPSHHASAAPTAPQSTNTSVAFDDFDPFADLLGGSAPSGTRGNEEDDELL